MSDAIVQALRVRIADSNAEVRRVTAIATHASVRDAIGRANDDLREADRELATVRANCTVEELESPVRRAERRLKIVHDALETFGPGAVLETTQHFSLLKKAPR